MELFLDANAHLPWSQPAVDAFLKFNSSFAGHGHALSPNGPGRDAENEIEKARNKIASILGAEQGYQIVFTSTCTQACEWSLDLFYDSTKGFHHYMSPMEHPAVRDKINKFKGGTHVVPITSAGIIDLGYPILEDSSMVCTAFQNETGMVQPIEKLRVKHLFADMCQLAGKERINLSSYDNLDFAVFGAHKFGGPASVGFFYMKDREHWKPQGTGSGYFYDRPGTPDVASIVAAAAALEHAYDTLDYRKQNMQDFKEVLLDLQDYGFKIPMLDAHPSTLFVKVPEGKNSSMIMLQLGQKRVHVGLGSACGSKHAGPSPLMKIIDRKANVGDYMRISQFGEYGKNEAKYFMSCIKQILES